MGAAAFWISLAAFLIAAMYFRSRSEANKHQTLRQIIERTGQVDERQLKVLFEPPPNAFTRIPPPGGGYRALRVFGALLMFIAAGLYIFFTLFALTNGRWNLAGIGYGAASIVLLVGAGLTFTARFLPPPAAHTDRAEGPTG